jgi:tetratricopeptide (TPR) repeat protein
MRRSSWIVVALLAACEPTKTETPGDPDTAALEDIETTRSPSSTDPEQPAAVAKGKDGKPVPKVRDRDPEEERKKLALSHQRSAEAAKHLASGRLVEAIDHSRQALKIHEQNVEAMLVMAEAYYGQKKFELVQAVTSSALAVDEKVRTGQETSRAHNLKGFAYVQMGQDNLATQAFRMAADADEKNASAWNNLGTRYMQAGDVATAKGCFAYALELDPRFAKAHVNIGAAHRADGKLTDAEKSLQAALKLRPNYPEAYFNLGLLYLDADPYPGLETVARLEKAIGYLTRYRELAIADGPDGPTTAAKGPKAASGPLPVSQARADDYIRVAKKGIEREMRRLDREKGRDKKPDDAGAAEPGAAQPTAKPTGKPTGKPGAAPADAAPDAATPDAAPKDPGTSPPATPPASPTKPASPQKPGAAKPTQPTTVQPTTPTPTTPTTPSKPQSPPPAAPVAKPSAPPASPPASPPPTATPKSPTTPPASPPPAAKPSAPAPQKPGVQKPNAKTAAAVPGAKALLECDRASAPTDVDLVRVAWNPRRCVDTHVLARADNQPARSPGVHALDNTAGIALAVPQAIA